MLVSTLLNFCAPNLNRTRIHKFILLIIFTVCFFVLNLLYALF